MNSINLSLYDFLGYLVPGFLFMILFSLFTEYALNTNLSIIYKDLNIFILFMAIYFSGHVIQAISKFFINFDKNTWWDNFSLSNDTKNILLNKYTKGIDRESINKKGLVRYMLLNMETRLADSTCASRIESCTAIRGLYRGLASVLILYSIFNIIYFIKPKVMANIIYNSTDNWLALEILPLLLLSVSLSIIFVYRYRRFAERKLLLIVSSIIEID